MTRQAHNKTASYLAADLAALNLRCNGLQSLTERQLTSLGQLAASLRLEKCVNVVEQSAWYSNKSGALRLQRLTRRCGLHLARAIAIKRQLQAWRAGCA